MSLILETLQISDLDRLLEFEKKKLQETVPDEVEREFKSWHARWRRESLEHYLNLGWSFYAADPENRNLIGYFLAQPLLFLDGQTQSLWVEHLQFTTLQARDALCDLAVRLSREKHLQKVYFSKNSNIESSLKPFKGEDWSPAVIQVKTTKV